MTVVPSGKTLLFAEELVERVGIRTIDLYLLEAWKLRSIGGLAELMNGLIRTRCLLSKLIAGEIENLKSLCMIGLV